MSGVSTDSRAVQALLAIRTGEDLRRDFTRVRACEITLARSRSTAAWRVDGRTVYEARGTIIPERARIGFGIWTMLPIRGGRSHSLDGQGMTARWRRFRVRGVHP